MLPFGPTTGLKCKRHLPSSNRSDRASSARLPRNFASKTDINKNLCATLMIRLSRTSARTCDALITGPYLSLYEDQSVHAISPVRLADASLRKIIFRIHGRRNYWWDNRMRSLIWTKFKGPSPRSSINDKALKLGMQIISNCCYVKSDCLDGAGNRKCSIAAHKILKLKSNDPKKNRHCSKRGSIDYFLYRPNLKKKQRGIWVN